MNGLYSCIIAVSMYSKIPMPNVEWTGERMRYVMCFFPLVGLAQGAVLGLWLHLALDVLNLSAAVSALVGAAVPLLVTGGIHMDGFLDTMDAVHSYGDRSRKLEILKDPHLGAFAVISFGVYMMLYLGVFHEYLSLVLREEMRDRYFLYAVPCLVFVMERAFSGLSVVTFPQAKKQGLAAGFGGAAKKKGRFPGAASVDAYLPGNRRCSRSDGLSRGGGTGSSPAYDPPGRVYMVLQDVCETVWRSDGGFGRMLSAGLRTGRSDGGHSPF